MDSARRDALPCLPSDSTVRTEPTITVTPTATATGDGPRRGGSRRGALHAAVVSVLAALGLREVAAQQNRATSGQHLDRDEHNRSKRGRRGKRGQAGSQGLPGGPGGPGASGAKGDKGDKGDPGPGKTVLTATTSWAPGFLFAGQSSSTAVEVPDAEPGDPVVAGLSSIGQASPPFGFVPLPIYGYVDSSGFVMVTITNLSPNMSATVPNGTLTVVVMKP